MKKKIKLFVAHLLEAIKDNPVEVFLSILFFIIGCYYYEYKTPNTQTALFYFPVIFLFTYTLNLLTWNRKTRYLYYLSTLSFLPFLLIDIPEHFVTCIVSSIIIQLVYLIAHWQKDNKAFMQTTFHYVESLLSATMLSFIAWLLSLSIYFSVSYIFDIWRNGEQEFIPYSFYFWHIGIMPSLFLMFNRQKACINIIGNRIINILVNYILSPALLIYTVILYLYFIKVTILWSLPKGAVAYIVASFASVTFILKGCQVFLEKHYYGWFYRYASLAVFPALIMYWVGSLYRVNEYGFTELRVYLIITGLILTGTAIMFLFKRTNHYLYVAILATILLSAVTYIPGITASDIEHISQSSRTGTPPDKYTETYFIHLQNSNPTIVEGYKTIQQISTYPTDGIWANRMSDTLYLNYGKDSILYKQQVDSLLITQLKKIGLSITDTIPENPNSQFFEIDFGSSRLVIRELSLSRDSCYHVTYIEPTYLLQQ